MLMKQLRTLTAVSLSILAGITMHTTAQTAELPYSINFTECIDGWAVSDNDGNGTTWDDMSYQTYGYSHYGFNSPNEDDLISPEFSLVKGATYKISTTIINSYPNGSEKLVLMAGTTKDKFKEVAPISVTSAGENANVIDFIPETDGSYCFAIRDISESAYFGIIGVLNFTIEKTADPVVTIPAVEVPYTIDFKDNCDGWTAADNNRDRYSWRANALDAYGVYMEGANAPHNDDLISPKFKLAKGKTYNISTVIELLRPSGEDILTLMCGTDKAAMTELKKLTVANQGANTDITNYTPEADGEYYFAIRNTTERSSSLPTLIVGVSSFSISENTAPVEGALISTDFSSENPLDGWTVLDTNADKNTWGFIDGINGVAYNSENAASSSDWLISPLMQLTEGQDYLVNYTLAQAGAFSADRIDVCMGTEATPDAMTTVLANETLEFANGNGKITGTQRISGHATGMYCIGFHVATAEPNGIVSLQSIHVKAVEKTVPKAITNLKSVSDSKAHTVTLTWTNPDKDTAGANIQTVDILIYENETLIHTMAGCTAGAEDTYTYTPAEFTGVVTYTVKAAIDGVESEAATTSICLDDIQGEKILVKTIGISSSSFANWNIVDNNNNGTPKYGKWIYDMGLYFKHELSKPTVEDDWAISPSFDLEPSKRYIVDYNLATHATGPATFDVTIGNKNTVEAQTRILQKQEDLQQNGFAHFHTNQFVVDSEGKYYIGFHVLNVAHSISISDISIYYIEPVSGIYETITGNTIAEVTVFDASGRIVAHAKGANVDMSAFDSGLYIVRTTDSLGHTTTTKFVK